MINDNVLDKISLLYVEDDKDGSRLVADFLQKQIKTLYTAKNGEEGLELFKKYRPDIVVTDIRMPVRDGLSMSEEIKKIDSNTIIIITSAYGNEKYFLKSIEIGIDGYVKKPIIKQKLIVTIIKFATFKIKEKQFEENAKFTEMILDMSPNFVMTVGDRIYYLNKSMLNFLDVKTVDEFNANYDINKYIVAKNPDEKDFFSWIKQHISKDGIIHIKRKKEILADARAYMAKIEKIPGYDRYLVILNDITNIEEEKEKFKELSIKDPLTGIYNRSKFFESLDSEIKRTKRIKEPFSLIMCDIDFFKTVNDTHGHQVGDMILKNISDIVSHSIREIDIFARYGGEEFILLLPDTKLDGAINLAQKLRKKIEDTTFDIVKRVTCSFGVAQYHLEESAKDIVKRVDKSLYLAKNRGRNRVEHEN